MAALDKLANAQPKAWAAAAKDWHALGSEAERSASAIYQDGSQQLRQSWRDAVGERAVAVFTALGDRFQGAAASSRGVALVLEGLGQSVQTLQDRLRTAVDSANRVGATVNQDGSVQIPPNASAADYGVAIKAMQEIRAALAEADTIDRRASKELNSLAGSAGRAGALNKEQASAAVSKLDMIRETLPDSRVPAENRQWWDSLTDQQREELKRAAPVQLYDMPGIPQQVRDELAGTGKFNRVELIRWAERNWNNTGIDMFDNNCAHFVSTALEESGLAHKAVPAGGNVTDSWKPGLQTDWNALDRQIAIGRGVLPGSYTPSWYNAEAQYKFWSANGGTEVPLRDALPGDLVYFRNAGGDWRVHHVSLVTAVTPDGDIHYTQHNSELLNASLNGRLPLTEVLSGDQILHVMRLNPAW